MTEKEKMLQGLLYDASSEPAKRCFSLSLLMSTGIIIQESNATLLPTHVR